MHHQYLRWLVLFFDIDYQTLMWDSKIFEWDSKFSSHGVPRDSVSQLPSANTGTINTSPKMLPIVFLVTHLFPHNIHQS